MFVSFNKASLSFKINIVIINVILEQKNFFKIHAFVVTIIVECLANLGRLAGGSVLSCESEMLVVGAVPENKASSSRAFLSFSGPQVRSK
jgi:hypothetical protein